MQARSIAFEAALNDLAIFLHQIAMAQTVPDSIADDLPERAVLLNLAQQLAPETLQLYYQIALLGRRDIGLAPDEFAGFTMTLLRMLAFAPTEKLSDKAAEKIAVKSTQPQQETVQNTAPTKPAAQPVISAITQMEPIENSTPEASSISPSSNNTFDGNWRKLVEQNLKLGLARALAQNCELISHDEYSLTLRVAETQKNLVSANYQNKLSSAINDYFGKKIKLNFEIGIEANTPAKQNATEKASIQSGAEAAILGDPFVQDLMQQFGAQIIPNSIKPN